MSYSQTDRRILSQNLFKQFCRNNNSVAVKHDQCGPNGLTSHIQAERNFRASWQILVDQNRLRLARCHTGSVCSEF